jgi:hypothetical protein
MDKIIYQLTGNSGKILQNPDGIPEKQILRAITAAHGGHKGITVKMASSDTFHITANPQTLTNL